MSVRVAEYAGFCFGVQRAVSTVYDIVSKEKDSRIYYPSPTPPSLPEEIVCLKSLIKDLELDIK